MKWVWVILGSLAVLIIIVVGVGMGLPREHVASTSTVIHAPVDSVWTAITTVPDFPRWRDGVSTVDILSEGDRLRWREETSQGPMTFERVESIRPRRQVVRIADADLPFGGTWTYDLQPEGARTRIRITEDGWVSNPIFRFMSRFVFGHHAAQEQYLESLGRRFGHHAELVRR